MKSGKRQMTGEIKLPNQEKIKNHGKGTNIYLEILETDTIKQAKRKEKRIHLENKKTTRNQTIKQKSHQRDEYLGCPPRKILGTILKV